jgi:hypothetical protein
MTDQQDRERESRLSDENKFEAMSDEVAEEQREVAQRLATDPLVNEDPDGDSS